jgi:hypothetical protein
VLAAAAAVVFRCPALTDVEVAIRTLVSLRDPDAAFWSALPLTDAAAVDRISARLVADPTVQARYAAVAAHRGGGQEIELVHPLAHSVFSIVQRGAGAARHSAVPREAQRRRSSCRSTRP